ncbi:MULTISPECIES: hypothetical protein [unclassified Streptomyces]|uniref:hypothetical protein n=1 Tax=unclassified Streptomyces TaxID=2593676 RepID=UPI000746BEA6|nr:MULTISPECIES: hypothetical protein [unclassified Streptomyces]KUL61520.1 hypothetical protein ADL30_07185 [Streptomyces sp. NRRL S-1521]THC49640.1 hypothetical protein E7X58_19735 [Streptomyces sp. A1499]
MATKTEDAAGAQDATGAEDAAETEGVTGSGTPEPKKGAAEVDVTKAAEPADAADDADVDAESDEEPGAAAKSAGVGQGAAAVVSVALGVVGLSGGWLGTVAGARSNIIGQLETAQSASVAGQIQALYGDSWKITALIAGIFALAALVIGFVVLVRPAFGAPGKEQAPWIKSVSWAGVALGVIGLLLAIAKYSDLLLGLPSAPS